MDYILTNQELVSSARALADELKMRVSLRPLEEAPKIRWGSSVGIYPVTKDTKYNSPSYIAHSRKDLFSSGMADSGIPCVEIHAGSEQPDHYPIVLRNTLNGNQGAGIQVVDGEYPRNMNVPWSYWYQFQYELGVHVFDGRIIRMFKKIWEDGSRDEPQYPIRNSSKGYGFRLVNVENFRRLPNLIEQFYSAFPIGFCRLDIGWDLDSETYRIIECNSAPCLTANYNTLLEYVKNFTRVFQTAN